MTKRKDTKMVKLTEDAHKRLRVFQIGNGYKTIAIAIEALLDSKEGK